MLEILQRPDFTLEMCADEFQVTLPALCAFLTSDRGLVLLAHTELAQAIHIRAIAIAQLPRVIDAMTYALEDFANTCRNVPINPKSMPALEFVERAKDTARRNGQLLLRLAHFTPRPLRAYTQPTHSPSPMGARAGGWVPSTSNPATPTQPTADHPAPPLPATRGEDRLAKGQATCRATEGNEARLNTHAVQSTTAAAPLLQTNPTRKRGATDAPTPAPRTDIQNRTSSPPPVLTSPERQRVGPPHPASPPRAPPHTATLEAILCASA